MEISTDVDIVFEVRRHIPRRNHRRPCGRIVDGEQWLPLAAILAIQTPSVSAAHRSSIGSTSLPLGSKSLRSTAVKDVCTRSPRRFSSSTLRKVVT